MMDIGAEYSIHPPQKKEVAERLLYNTLNQTYGFENVDHVSPVYESLEVNDGVIESVGVLNNGTTQQVRNQVFERLEMFSEGGGFVFNTVHYITRYGPRKHHGHVRCNKSV